MVTVDGDPTLLGIKSGGKIYFVGIGGYSMCGLAAICQSAGFLVRGSDMEMSSRTKQLAKGGVLVYHGHKSDYIDDFKPDCVVYSVAVDLSNPEISRARELGIPLFERSYFLGGINRLYKNVINISGTHGKTTTTTMCSLILVEAGLDPTAHIGAMVSDWGNTVRIGKSHDIFVSEACEYNSSFLRFYSTTAAILNIDHDHVDCFPKIEDVIDVFAEFACTVPPTGSLVIPSFDRNIPAMLKKVQDIKISKGEEALDLPEIITFGREFDLFNNEKPNFYISNYKLQDGYPSFDVYRDNSFLCHIDLVIPGEYNAMNALAAIACAVINGADSNSCARVVSNFHGADNRFSDRGTYKGAAVIADYAHHPSAISASFLAASDITKGRVWPVFQPITFNRVIGLFDEFVSALLECPDSMIFEVYTSRESDSQGFSAKMICDKINSLGGKSNFMDGYETLKAALDEKVSPGDLILFMGPEGLKEIADRLVVGQ